MFFMSHGSSQAAAPSRLPSGPVCATPGGCADNPALRSLAGHLAALARCAAERAPVGRLQPMPKAQQTGWQPAPFQTPGGWGLLVMHDEQAHH